MAKDAPIKAAVWRTIPMERVVLVPHFRVHIVVKGETINACEMVRPQMNA